MKIDLGVIGKATFPTIDATCSATMGATWEATMNATREATREATWRTTYGALNAEIAKVLGGYD